jgi:hypothetical protein
MRKSKKQKQSSAALDDTKSDNVVADDILSTKTNSESNSLTTDKSDSNIFGSKNSGSKNSNVVTNSSTQTDNASISNAQGKIEDNATESNNGSKTVAIAQSVNVLAELSETKDLIINYVKQETLGPILALKRKIIFGFLGALCYGISLLLISIALLRFLQEQFTIFSGNLNWLPYVIDIVGTLILTFVVSVFVVMRAIKSKPVKNE